MTLQYMRQKPIENIVGNVENTGKHNFLLFSLYFLPFQNPIEIIVCKINAFSNWPKILTLSQTSPCFYVSAVQFF